MWGFKKLSNDVKYLGMPLFLSANKSKDFAFVKENLSPVLVTGRVSAYLKWGAPPLLNLLL